MSVQRLRVQSAATIVLVFGLLLLGPMLYLQNRWLSEEVDRAEALALLRRIPRDLAQGHLWFEENLVGDAGETDEKWQTLFLAAQTEATDYRELVRRIDPRILARRLRLGEQQVATHEDTIGMIAVGIGRMQEIADQRVAEGQRAGSKLDARFDAVNENVDHLIDIIAADWGELSAAESRERLGYFRVSFVLWFGCLTGFILLLFLVERRRRRAEEEQEQLRARFQQAQKLESLGVLAGGIAHDFNNLLMGVLGTTSLALLEEGVPSKVANQLREIERAARKSADLTSQLLAYAGKGKFTEEPIDLAALVGDLESLLRVSLGPNVVVEQECDPDLPTVEGNPTQLQQVVMNLLINASDAMGEEGGRIHVRLSSEECTTEELLRDSQGAAEPPTGRYVKLEVEDEGPGMDASALARCFEPFYTTKFTGRGLGLAAVVGIIRAHHGVIRVWSRPGEGARFTILFPAAGERTAPRAPHVPATTMVSGSGRLLVIDDDESVRALIDRMLQRCGYEVITAASGEEGARMFRQEHEGLRGVLVDMEMPGMSGVQTGALLHQHDPSVPIVLTSGYSDDLLREGDGFVGFIQKPYKIEELSSRLHALLGSSTNGHANGGHGNGTSPNS